MQQSIAYAMLAVSVCTCLILLSFQDSPVQAVRLPRVDPEEDERVDLAEDDSLDEEQWDAESVGEYGAYSDFGCSDIANASIKPKSSDMSRWRLRWHGDGSFNHSATSPANHTSYGFPFFDACRAKLIARAAENCGGLGCRLVLVGDSILDRILSERCYRGAPHKNSSHYFSMIRKQVQIPESWRPLILAGSGDQTQHTLGHLNRTLPLLKTPQVFMVLIGTNNLFANNPCCFSANETAYGIRAVVESIRRSHPKSNILVHAILPRGDIDNIPGVDMNNITRTIDETNAQVRAFYKRTSSSDPSIDFIDCGQVFPHRADDDAGMKHLMADYLHPTHSGYTKWFACLRPLLERAINQTTNG
eukprot:gnl/TRDRNA2_/TRDRNA2_176332_c0_seq10.p1 gnl/TRDRNA2_/TRDRNA2_176332_c0~~gnl/TRDRNA2_/TRDRNA2_176332_c0_seq10.p1  ORF type:complete len:360 (-),score=13.09 gnl/TRDRNA2_/TRDRNA2_176332_c0_seq10:207-1286(-)